MIVIAKPVKAAAISTAIVPQNCQKSNPYKKIHTIASFTRIIYNLFTCLYDYRVL